MTCHTDCVDVIFDDVWLYLRPQEPLDARLFLSPHENKKSPEPVIQRIGAKKMAPATGLEPVTGWLTATYSTD